MRYRLPVIAVLVISGLGAACGQKQLSEDEKKQVEALKSELSVLQADIADAGAQAKKYQTGLIGVVATLRLEVSKSTEALAASVL